MKKFYWCVEGEDVYSNSGVIEANSFEEAFNKVKELCFNILQKHTLEKLRIVFMEEDFGS